MISKIDLINWKLNPRINPCTNRKISPKGKIYKKFSKSYQENFKLDLNKLEDHIDIISQDRFINILNGKLVWVFTKIEDLVFYQEENIVRAFTKQSIQYLKLNKMSCHPISGKKIPADIFNSVENIKEVESTNLQDLAKTFFQLLSKHSIFIDYKKYLKLSEDNLQKLEYELKDFYYKNLGENIRKSIDKKDGDQLFKNSPTNSDEFKKYLLNEMTTIIKNIDKDSLIFSYYIIVGALSIVIPQVKEDYPNYNFSF